jgi:hypothetical protein
VSAVRDARVRGGSLLEVALGLRALASRFDDILCRHGQSDEATALTTDSEWLFIVLGAVALRERLERVWPPAQAPHLASTRTPLGGLLR